MDNIDNLEILLYGLYTYGLYTSLSSKLELHVKGLVKPETASSTRSTLHLNRLNI